MGLNQSIPRHESNLNTDPRKIEKFMQACQEGNIPVINGLIKDGINPSFPENRGLVIASSNGRLEVVRLLLSNDLVQLKNPSSFIAALVGSILNEHLDISNLLLTKVESLVLSNSDQNLLNRALIMASERAFRLVSPEYSEISDRLIEIGADPTFDRRPRPGFRSKNKSTRKSVRKTKKSGRKKVRKTKK